ncbi:hypothetical protein AMELA_G00235320 [Ameiurus melas]|uniref:Uncharacterized protein n=1 Tax=Ameiurus melas TaxID=219545 RepID=A0A7J5ZY04_AMEME|nr:hypothetical protein AMELA_G00235320 [Ameiurus melas]
MLPSVLKLSTSKSRTSASELKCVHEHLELTNITDKMFSVFWTLLLPLLVGSTPISQEHFPIDCSDVYANGQTLSGVYTI